MVRTEFVRFLAEDGVEMQGLYTTPATTAPRQGIVHVHGMAGNFYEPPFVDRLAQTLAGQGYAFLCFNTRGHDYLADLAKWDGAGWTELDGGRAYDVFADSLHDLGAACEFLRARGVVDICLQGHSSGTNKAVFCQHRRQYDDVRAMVLLSPNDDIGLQQAARGDQFAAVLEVARGLVAHGRGDELMPVGPSFPISAGSYLDYFGPRSLADVFPFRQPEAAFPEVASLRCPLLILFGGDGDYVLGDLTETLELLRRKATANPRVDVGIVAGAPHDYRGHEEELARIIAEWMGDVMPVA